MTRSELFDALHALTQREVNDAREELDRVIDADLPTVRIQSAATKYAEARRLRAALTEIQDQEEDRDDE